MFFPLAFSKTPAHGEGGNAVALFVIALANGVEGASVGCVNGFANGSFECRHFNEFEGDGAHGFFVVNRRHFGDEHRAVHLAFAEVEQGW